MRILSALLGINLILAGCVQSRRPSPPHLQSLCDEKADAPSVTIRLTEDVGHPALFLKSGGYTIFVNTRDLVTMLKNNVEEFKNHGGDSDSVMLLSKLGEAMPLTADYDLRLLDESGTNNLLVASNALGKLLEQGSALVVKDPNTGPSVALQSIAM